MKRVEKVALYPTRAQERILLFILDVLRQLYNAALEQRREAYRRRGIRVTGKQQYAELTALRQEASSLGLRLATVYRECEDAVLHRLDLAFAAFFRRLRTGEKAGYPRFRPHRRWNQIAFPHGNRALRLDARQSRVIVPGVGAVKLRKGRTIPLTYGRAWLVRRNDRWYACFECEREVHPLPAARPLPSTAASTCWQRWTMGDSFATLPLERSAAAGRHSCNGRWRWSRSAIARAECATAATRSGSRRSNASRAPKNGKPTRAETTRTKKPGRSSTVLTSSLWSS
jgi:hypothetical protein